MTRAPSPGATIEFAGQELVLPPVIQADKRAIHRWANAVAVAELSDLADAVTEGVLSPAEYGEFKFMAMAEILAGRLHPDEQAGAMRQRTRQGIIQTLFVCLTRGNPKAGITRPFVERMERELGERKLWDKYTEANPPPPKAAGAASAANTPPENTGTGLESVPPSDAPDSSNPPAAASPSSTA